MTDQDRLFDDNENGDDPVARAIDDLRILAEGVASSAEAELILRRLQGSNALHEVLRLIGLGTGAAIDDGLEDADAVSAHDWIRDLDDQDEETIEFLPGDAEERVYVKSVQLPEALTALRQEESRAAISAAVELIGQTHRRGCVILIADGGQLFERDGIAFQISRALADNSSGVNRLDINRDDPSLSATDRDDRLRDRSAPLTVLDGDLAPTLSDVIQRDGRSAYAIVAPDTTLDALSAILQPDLVVGLTPASATRLVDPLNEEEEEQALRQVLEMDGPAPVRFRLPVGDRLIAAIERYVDRAALEPEHRASEVLRLLRRLSLGARAGDARRALAALNKLDQRFAADDPAHWLSWSALYRDVGLIWDAKDVLDRVPEQWHGDVRIRHMRANLDVLLGEPGAAIERLAGLDPSPHIDHARARAYRRMGDLIAAADTAVGGLERAPDNIYLLIEAGIVAALRRHHQEADGFFVRARTLMPTSGVVLNAWGRAVAESGWAERADRLFARASDLEPWNERHHLERARLAARRGLIAQSEELLRPLLDSAVVLVKQRATIQLINTLLQSATTGSREEAERFLTNLEEDSDFPGGMRPKDQLRVVSLRMQLLTKHGNPGEAIQLAMRQDTVNPYLVAQQISAKLREPDQRSSAWTDLSTLRQTAEFLYLPSTQRVEATLHARLLLADGQVDAARASLIQALRRDPTHPVLLNMLGGIERSVGRFDVAEAVYLASLEIDPANAFTHRGLAVLYRETGRWDDAERYTRYVRFVGLEPNDSTINVINALTVLE